MVAPVNITREELSRLMEEAVERGARRAVTGLLGIDENDERVAKDFRELREMLGAVQLIKRGALVSLGRVLGLAALILFTMVLTKFSDQIFSAFKG